jgi:hypothetical protein
MAIWSILRTLGIFYDYSVHFEFIWYMYVQVLVSFTKKNLATLLFSAIASPISFNIGSKSILTRGQKNLSRPATFQMFARQSSFKENRAVRSIGEKG